MIQCRWFAAHYSALLPDNLVDRKNDCTRGSNYFHGEYSLIHGMSEQQKRMPYSAQYNECSTMSCTLRYMQCLTLTVGECHVICSLVDLPLDYQLNVSSRYVLMHTGGNKVN